jgi:hypothetical protein
MIRKTKTIGKVPNMDSLPMDVIRFMIAPYCDYETRVHLICSLPPVDRYSVRLNKEACIMHDLYVCMKYMTTKLKKTMEIDTIKHQIKRYNKIVEIIEEFNNPRYFNLIIYCKPFREMFTIKLLEFSDIDESNIKSNCIGKKRLEILRNICLSIFDKRMKCTPNQPLGRIVALVI